MYLEHFKLRELPFRLSPDPAFLYPSQIHSRAKAYMESTIWFTDGFVVITGEIGSGKTTLIETFLKEIDQDVVVAQINQTQVSPIEFLQAVLAQFGFSPFRMRKAELLATLNNFLIEQYANGRKVLLVVDEAQNLTNKVLEEVRLLSGVETTKEKVLRIILAGQPELNVRLDSPELTQLRQRVRLRFHLNALTEQEMAAYVGHRLGVAGATYEIFEPDTFPLVYRYTGGIPRLINTLCDTSLLAAFAQDQPTVGVATVHEAIEELQWQEYHARTHTNLIPARLEETAPHPRPPVGRLVLTLKGVELENALIAPGRFVIGRTSDNDLQVDSKFVSRHHAQLVTTPDGSVIEDLNSTNGVYLNGKRVRRHRLTPGDVVKIGMHEIVYSRYEAPPAPEDDSRATRTTVLTDEDYDGDDEGEANDGEPYSSIARGS
ncbi:MAG TPA: AAA family ATPase [Steroidobacteraceae bacterium]|nr:AAA family ATPase [Steroidobacteraceae bacterium]